MNYRTGTSVTSGERRRMNLTLEPAALERHRAKAMAYLQGLDLRFGSVLQEIMRYAFESADPVCASLCLWSTETFGGDADAALPVAASIECLHRFAALHDELQTTGASFEGSGTVAATWGLAQTLNAGDAFHAVALRLLAVDARHPERTLKAGVMLTQTVLDRIDRRSHEAARLRRSTSAARDPLRAAAEATWTLMLSASLRAGAILAGASDSSIATFSRLGRFLGIIVQLGSDGDEQSRHLAERYAEKAASGIERTSLRRVYVQDFKEIVYRFATAT
jgi:geranylgeranyl pyrophosphate synthase